MVPQGEGPVGPGQAAMAAGSILAFIVLLLTQLPPMAGEELQEATMERLQQRADFPHGKTTWLQQDAVLRNPEQSDSAWGALLPAAWTLAQLLTVSGYLVLLFSFCLWLRKRIRQREHGGDEQESCLCPSSLKTVVMHLLNTIPTSNWTRASFLMQLQDVLVYLRSCLEEKHLPHFFLGNDRLPEDIVLPPAFREAKPLNLFQCLQQDPEAYSKALAELEELEGRLTGLLL